MVPASAQNSSPTSAAKPQTSDAPAAARENAKQQAALIFQHGEDALKRGRLNEAEHDFRQILALDPQAGAAYANLGVVYMRRKQWTEALETLRKAQRMLPQMAGIRLNIGLAYYRQNEFLLAIPLFESVVRDQPGALQARYLLGQCYFFASRWADAAVTLELLWPQESTQLNYLYVLSIAASRRPQGSRRTSNPAAGICWRRLARISSLHGQNALESGTI
jgi:tetratricopeptide (TPR) repeat protein